MSAHDGAPVKPRAEVRQFAELMERKLLDNDHKGGWEEDEPEELLARMCEELAELVDCFYPTGQIFIASHHLKCAAMAIRSNGDLMTRAGQDPIGEAVDVANFAMMLAEVLKIRGKATGR